MEPGTLAGMIHRNFVRLAALGFACLGPVAIASADSGRAVAGNWTGHDQGGSKILLSLNSSFSRGSTSGKLKVSDHSCFAGKRIRIVFSSRAGTKFSFKIPACPGYKVIVHRDGSDLRFRMLNPSGGDPATAVLSR
jgi:hypothetical protein